MQKRQTEHLQKLQKQKEEEKKKEEEEEKRKLKLKQQAREQVQKMVTAHAKQPSLLDQQKMEDEEQEQDDGVKVKKTKKRKVVTGNKQVDNFLERNKPKQSAFPNIVDFAQWKKKMRLDENQKVFICTGGYPDIKKSLKQRGWVENKDPNSPCFDFKWTLKTKDIDHNLINDNQIVNHFNKATSITTKVGLCHNLKNLIWYNNIDVDTFFPSCFDLAVNEDLDDFIEEFKAIKAESYVKIFVREMRE